MPTERGPDDERLPDGPIEGFLLRRTRLVLWIMLATGFAFTAIELAIAPALGPHTAVKALGLASMVGAFLWLRRPWAEAHIFGLSLGLIASAHVLTALSGALSPTGEYTTSATLFVAAAVITATLLPWGMRHQLMSVGVACAVLLVCIWYTDRSFIVLTTDPAAAVVVGLVASVVVAREMARSRAATLRHHRLHQAAEERTRALNLVLERRVQERTAALETANRLLREEVEERIRMGDALLRAEEQARQRQDDLAHVQRLHLVNHMAAALAHEIHQPLCAIANYAQGVGQRLRAGDANLEEILPIVARIDAEALRAGDILRGVRRMVERQTAASGPVDVGSAIAEAVDAVQLQARRQGVDIQVAPSSAQAVVLADKTQFEQVVVNLVLNGIDAASAASARGKVSISSRVLPEAVEVIVSDSGAGVSSGTGPRLFTPFFTTKTGGLGMGLAISRAIVEAHGGNLRLLPSSGGAAFGFTLPRTEAPDALESR